MSIYNFICVPGQLKHCLWLFCDLYVKGQLSGLVSEFGVSIRTLSSLAAAIWTERAHVLPTSRQETRFLKFIIYSSFISDGKFEPEPEHGNIKCVATANNCSLHFFQIYRSSTISDGTRPWETSVPSGQTGWWSKNCLLQKMISDNESCQKVSGAHKETGLRQIGWWNDETAEKGQWTGCGGRVKPSSMNELSKMINTEWRCVAVLLDRCAWLMWTANMNWWPQLMTGNYEWAWGRVVLEDGMWTELRTEHVKE